MNILFISSYYLFDKTRFGGSKRLYLLAKELQKHATVTLLCLDGCEEIQTVMENIQDHSDFKRFLFVPKADNRSFLKKIFSSGLIIENELISQRDAIAPFLNAESYDAVVLAFPLALSFINTVITPGAFPIIYIEDDLFLEKIQFEKRFSFFAPLYRFFRHRQLRLFYQKKLAYCKTILAISNQEKDLLKKRFPKANVGVLGYGIPLEEFPFIPSFPSAFSIGFIGNYYHTPNAEGLRWFLQAIYPTLQASIPALKFYCAGRSIPQDVRNAYSRNNSIQWLCDIENLADFYSNISVFVNPIISGRGMRTKLIECAAFGRPIISTRLGCEGFEEFHVEVAETAGEFAASCHKFIANKSLLPTIAKANRTIIEQQYTIEKVGQKLFLELQSANRTKP